MRIYVASSWRNDYQPTVVDALRTAGYEVYDFRAPKWNDNGFHWSEIDGAWQDWDFERYVTALTHPLAESGFKSDMDGLEWADVCVLVLPCGRSAHLELGWAIGRGKPTAILHHPTRAIEPELMGKMAGTQLNSIEAVVQWLATDHDGPNLDDAGREPK